MSWPRSVGQEPLYYNALSTGRPPGDVDLNTPAKDTDSRYVSRYSDEQDTPHFPFGYGRSYTSFGYGPITISESQISAANLNHRLKQKAGTSTPLIVEASISNTGPAQAKNWLNYNVVCGAPAQLSRYVR
ncbi:MAG: hypothetical protein NVSMB58_36810 [Terriglobales bacterium]